MIEFTQYHLPDGRKTMTGINMDAATEDKAHKLIEARCHFDIEILSTGIISMTCENNSLDDEVLSCRLSKNGPEIKENVKKLVDSAYSAMFDK